MVIYFGKTAEESYFRINGQNCGSPSAVQSDFSDGVAYVGWFFNDTKGGFNFKVNSNVNAVAVTAPVDDKAYAMDLAKAADFEISLINVNAEGDITVKDARRQYLGQGYRLHIQQRETRHQGFLFRQDRLYKKQRYFRLG